MSLILPISMKSVGLRAGGVTRRHLATQGTNDEQRLMVHLHKVDVNHHTDQGDDYGTGENGCVLERDEETGIEVKNINNFSVDSGCATYSDFEKRPALN